MSVYKVIVLNPETRDCIAILRSPEEDLGENDRSRIPTDHYVMHTWDGIGDGFIYHDGYHNYAWSPFHHITEAERNNSGFIDDNVIWMQDYHFRFELEYNGTKYYFGTRWVSTPATYLYTFDPDTGELLEEVSYEDLPELENADFTLVMDFNNDGQDEIVVLDYDRYDSGD